MWDTLLWLISTYTWPAQALQFQDIFSTETPNPPSTPAPPLVTTTPEQEDSNTIECELDTPEACLRVACTASTPDNLAMIKYVISMGDAVDLSQPDESGKSALQICAINSVNEGAGALLAAGVSPNIRDTR